MSSTELGEENAEVNGVLTDKWPQILSYYKQINIDYENKILDLSVYYVVLKSILSVHR